MENENVSLKEQIVMTLNDVGVPANLEGYRCLKVAVELVIEDERKIARVTKELYPEIAKEVGAKTATVEKNISHAIEACFDRISCEGIEEYFANSLKKKSGKLANSEFIARIAEIVKLKIGMYK